MALAYSCKLEPEENGWWLVRFPAIPEALTEGETRAEAIENARDCLIAALEGYVSSGQPLRRDTGVQSSQRIVLPSRVTAKLALYETMRNVGWSKAKLAKELDVPENTVRRLLNLRHNSHLKAIDDAMAKMKAELAIDLPPARGQRKSAA